MKNLKQNFQNLKKSRNELKIYRIHMNNKMVEVEKAKTTNSMFITIKNDLEKKKHDKIEDYEKFYKIAQESSKRRNNYQKR